MKRIFALFLSLLLVLAQVRPVAAVDLTELKEGFSMLKLTIIPEEVVSGETVKIKALFYYYTNEDPYSSTLENVYYKVTLRINGVLEETQDMRLYFYWCDPCGIRCTASKTDEALFTVVKDTPGIYSIEVNGLTGSFTVYDRANLPAGVKLASPTPEPVPASGLNWGLAFGIAGAVILQVLLIFLLAKKRVK